MECGGHAKNSVHKWTTGIWGLHPVTLTTHALVLPSLLFILAVLQCNVSAMECGGHAKNSVHKWTTGIWGLHPVTLTTHALHKLSSHSPHQTSCNKSTTINGWKGFCYPTMHNDSLDGLNNKNIKLRVEKDKLR